MMALLERRKPTAVDPMTVYAAILTLSKLSTHALAVMHREATARNLLAADATKEAKRTIKNEKQQAFRATPEGREYANEASRKSTAHKKEVEALMRERVTAQRNGVS